MDLHLEQDDAELLRSVLDSTWRDLRYEIADTDNMSFKHELRVRAEHLRALLDKCGGPLPDRPFGA